MKNVFIYILATIVVGCGESNTTTSHADSLNAKVDSQPAVNTNIDMVDTFKSAGSGKIQGIQNEFADKAATGGIQEVTMGKLAQENSNFPDIKEYGLMLEKDHGEAGKKLAAIAASENIALPAVMTQEQTTHINHMKGLRNAEFDREFISMMIDDHEKDIAEFKTAATSNENEKIKKFASSTLPILEKHLTTAMKIKAKIK